MADAPFNPPVFSGGALQRVVEMTIAEQVPEGKRGALVAVATTAGVRVAVAAKIGDHWQVMGTLDKPHDGPLSGAAAVTATW